MRRNVSIGLQNFEGIRTNDCFYVDKTLFIKDWWERGDAVTVITRPRRFGKTLMLNTVEYFFSEEHKDKGCLFDGLGIWQSHDFRQLQGTLPVISLSFADVKATSFPAAIRQICRNIRDELKHHRNLLSSAKVSGDDKELFERYLREVSEEDCLDAVRMLSRGLSEHCGEKVLILLDEYDTPMQEAYAGGFWNEISDYMRSLFNVMFKTNPYLHRALLTGITRVGKESMFSDFNNPALATMISDLYADSFGFTENEVFLALDEMGYTREDKESIKEWYDGFTVGNVTDIYNPWSIVNFLAYGKIDLYWSHTSSNEMVSHLLQTGDRYMKQQFEDLIRGDTITVTLNEQIDFRQLECDPNVVWSLLHAVGYLKILSRQSIPEAGEEGVEAVMTVTNRETRLMFRGLVREWFSKARSNYNDFTKALLRGNLEEMEAYFESVSETIFSSFDSGTDVSERAPERFYHGFVLGLIVELRKRYLVKSNRESGLGRYDVMLLPKDRESDDGIIIEFKVFNKKRERSLEETASAALNQIEQRHYAEELLEYGLPRERIHEYGFAFRGKEVIIRGNSSA